ncbi:hypothetical protein [Citrobacter meridianamericanus]|uniref:hypothetical protein n=1 Tax=Citrobacter meridianamericanus TaxID=2894201 RepID=UPI0039C3B00B
MNIAERLDSWSTPITFIGGALGLVSIVVFGSLNHTTIKTSVPAGTFVSSQFYPGQSSPSYVVASPQGGLGIAAPIGGDTPDRTFVRTDKGQFIVRGAFLAAEGQALELRTAIDKTKYLCPADDNDGCHAIEPRDSIETAKRAGQP